MFARGVRPLIPHAALITSAGAACHSRRIRIHVAATTPRRCRGRLLRLRLRRQSAALKKQYIIFLQVPPTSPRIPAHAQLSLVWVHLYAAGLRLHSPLSCSLSLFPGVCLCGFCRLAGHVRETGVIVIYLSASDQPK